MMLESSFLLLAQATWVYNHLPIMVFIFMFGACVGSFINVVNGRLPMGMSIISPPSRCPTCGARLKFFTENVPIIGWLLLRGRCRYCKVRISPEYMIVELIMALMFLALYIVLYVVPPTVPYFGEIADAWWYGSRFANGFFATWPAYIAVAFLLAGLLSMTVIDARTFTIPIPIPLFVTVTAFIAWPVQSLIPVRSSGASWPIVTGGWDCFAICVCGMLGVVVTVVLLKLGILKHSFADYDDYLTSDDDTLADYPHARREMLVELRILAPIMLGLMVGYGISRVMPTTAPPPFVQAITGSFAGYLMGAGLVWTIRVLGTLGFGKEAMGMGDVHLLGAVGAVLGWLDPIFIFFLAPFSGIAWVIASLGLGRLFKSFRRELPYGPHLAMATIILMLFGRSHIYPAYEAYIGMPLPQPGFITEPHHLASDASDAGHRYEDRLRSITQHRDRPLPETQPTNRDILSLNEMPSG